MLNRRHLRIKLLHILYAYKQGSFPNKATAERELMESLNKFRELYFYLLSLFGDVHHAATMKMEDGKKKKLPTEEDLNPNTRLINNPVLVFLNENRDIKNNKDHFKIDVWSEEQELIRHLLRISFENPIFLEYMQAPKTDFAKDKTALVHVFRKVWINDEKLQFFLEEKSILWTDDLDLAASMVIKTLKAVEESDDEFKTMLPLFRDELEDKDYFLNMFRKAIDDWDKHVAWISDITPNWESDRIALIDMLLLNLAITEARYCKDIPTKVTINEFIEISKFYSTENSKTFLNGVLDKLFQQLKTEGEIKKIGRGLIE
ncbi:MAG: N utilization substance protein B [Sphingobacteriales bacterium]|jgi:N utilization substance protein B